MKKAINTIIPILCIIILGFTIVNIKDITLKIAKILNNDPKLTIGAKNNYTKDIDYLFVQKTEEYRPYNYQDLLNIYYSVLDNGFGTFTFYCPSEYTKCLKDVEKISNDQIILSHINNYVHPFNSFANIYTSYDETGEVTIKVTNLYTSSQIKYINDAVKNIINTNISSNNDNAEKVKIIHDYIINNTKYDQTAEKSTILTEAYNAYGLLKNHLATCNGYSDMMAIFLFELGINNYKIATTPTSVNSGHVWNGIFINNEWLHLDLTWDDPVSNTSQDYLYHKYFLVNNEGLIKADSGEVMVDSHNFKDSIYLEYKKK